MNRAVHLSSARRVLQVRESRPPAVWLGRHPRETHKSPGDCHGSRTGNTPRPRSVHHRSFNRLSTRILGACREGGDVQQHRAPEDQAGPRLDRRTPHRTCWRRTTGRSAPRAVERGEDFAGLRCAEPSTRPMEGSCGKSAPGLRVAVGTWHGDESLGRSGWEWLPRRDERRRHCGIAPDAWSGDAAA
jgi:hypothetical protein